MSKKIIALLIALTLILASIPMSVSAAPMIQAAFSKSTLTAGNLGASISLFDMNAGEQKKVFAALLYQDADGALLDFSAATVTTERNTYGFYSADIHLSLHIPETVTDGHTARIIVLDALTLAPISLLSDSTIKYVPASEPVYTGMFERYYTLDSEDGSIAIISEGTRKYVRVADAGTSFRLKDMSDGYVSFVDSTSTRYRLQSSNGAPGRGMYTYGGSDAMLWKLIPEGDRYYIEHHDGGYLAIENGAAVISETPYAFSLTFADESAFTLMTSLPGFKLFTEEEQQRIIDICTSVGASVFPRGDATGAGTTFLDKCETAFSQLYNNRQNSAPEDQKAAILKAVQTPLYSGIDDFINLNPLPGGDAAITRSEVMREKLYIWDTGEKEYNRVDVTYTTADSSQTVKFYYDETGAVNVEAAIEAVGRFPYKYRQYLKQVNVYVPAEGFSYNCDGPVLTVRVYDNTSADAMTRGFAHELGHSIDMAGGGDYTNTSTHWCQSKEWQRAATDDLVIVSDYAAENYYEGLAEFARLYFQCYGSRDRMIGLKQLFPNQYESFGHLLERAGMEHLF